MSRMHSGFSSQLSRFALAVAGAKSHAKELPKEATVARAKLESLEKSLFELNTEHERAKRALSLVTGKLQTAITSAADECGRIIRLAEATFGPRDVRIREFRRPVSRRGRPAANPPAVESPPTAVNSLKVA